MGVLKGLIETWWFRTLAAIVSVVGGLIGILAATGVIGGDGEDPREKASNNVEILFDASAAMAADFDGGTKLDVAKDAVEEALQGEVDDNAFLALRQFGGACGDENTELSVPFDRNNKEKVRDALAALEPIGESDLAPAVNEAAGDFNPPEQFEGVRKQIIVITAGAHTCDEDPIPTIERRLEGTGLVVDYRFIGLALSPEGVQQLEGIAAVVAPEADLAVINATNREELESAVTVFTKLEPIMLDTEALLTLTHEGVASLNEIPAALNGERFDEAETKIDEARREFEEAGPRIEGLRDRRDEAEFQKLAELVESLRELQARMLDMGEEMISVARSDDVDARNEQVAAWNDLVAQHDGIFIALGDEVDALREMLAQGRGT